MKRYIRSDRHYSGNKYIVVLQDGELLKHDDGRIIQLNDEVATASVDSLAEASKAVREYIDEKLLGSSTFTGGQVLDAHTHKPVARISYNGRIWDLDDNEISDIDIDEVSDDEYEDIVDAILNNKPYDFDRFHEYWQAFHQPEKGAIRADQVKVGDVLKNTEDATEFDIGDVFKVNSVEQHTKGWEEFDYTFNITLLKGAEKYVDSIDTFDIHYMADEYVGVPVKDVNASTRITASKKVKVSQELRSILEDVMIDTLDNYSGPHVLKEFVENARYLQVWDEYDNAHPDEMDELSWLSNNKLVDIGAEILDEINANWSGDGV